MYILKQYISKAKSSQFFQDSFWALFGNTISKGLALLGAIVVARYLGKESYGEYTTIRTTIISIAIFSTFGLGYTTTTFIAENKNRSQKFLSSITTNALQISLLVSSLLAFILFVFSEYIAVSVLEASHLSVPLKLVAIWVILNSLTTTQTGILSGIGAFKKMAKINMFVGIFAFLSSAILAYFFNLHGALVALLLTQLLNYCLYRLEIIRTVTPSPFRYEGNTGMKKKLIRFSIPVALQEGLNALTNWLAIYVLIKFSNFGEVGFYNAAIQWAVLILFIPLILNNVILNHLSQNKSDKTKHSQVLKHTLIISSISSITPFIIISIFNNQIEQIYGEGFNGLGNIIILCCSSTLFISIINVYTQVFISIKKTWTMFNLKLLKGIGVLIMTYFLIIYDVSGAKSLAISTLFVNFFLLLFIIILYYKVFREPRVSNFPIAK